MNNTPLVSVIIPTYNRAHILARSIDSVLNQTYKHLELIIIDDCSDDNTEEFLLKNYNDTRIRYIKQLDNQGSNAARNRGIKEAFGDFIAFQDSDDAWFSHKLEVLVPELLNSPDNVGAIFHKTRLNKFDGSTSEYPLCYILPKNFHQASLLQNYVGTVSLIIKKHFIQKIGGFDEELPRLQDWDLSIRLSSICDFLFVNEVLVDAFHQKESISSDGSKLKKALNIFYFKYQSEIENLPNSLQSKVLNKYGSLLCREGITATGKKYLMKSLMRNPFNCRSAFQLSASFIGSSFYRFIVFKILKKKLL